MTLLHIVVVEAEFTRCFGGILYTVYHFHFDPATVKIETLKESIEIDHMTIRSGLTCYKYPVAL